MSVLYELSWLWMALGIALMATAVCVICAALICRIANKKFSKGMAAFIGATAFAAAVLVVIMLAGTPMSL